MSVQCLHTPTPPSSVLEDTSSINLVKMKMDTTRHILDEIQARLEKQLKLQEEVLSEQVQVMSSQDKILDGFQEKLSTMEEEVVFNNHMSGLYERLLDDHDQIARKINLRLQGIELFDDDSPQRIIGHIKDEVKRLKLSIEEEEYDTAQRMGAVYVEGSMKKQDVLLKMRCCLGRNEIYIHRHRFHFQVTPDLTAKREKILEFARRKMAERVGPEVVEGTGSRGMLESVYVDMDCKLQAKTKCGRSVGFSSEEEFLSLYKRFSGRDCTKGKCYCYDVD